MWVLADASTRLILDPPSRMTPAMTTPARHGRTLTLFSLENTLQPIVARVANVPSVALAFDFARTALSKLILSTAAPIFSDSVHLAAGSHPHDPPPHPGRRAWRECRCFRQWGTAESCGLR